MNEIVAGDMVTVPDGHGHAPFGKAYEVLSIDDYGYATLMSGAWKMKVPVTKCVRVPQIEPPNVHSGGPYIARSVYEECLRTIDSITKGCASRDREITCLQMEIHTVRSANKSLTEQRDFSFKEREKLVKENRELKEKLEIERIGWGNKLAAQSRELQELRGALECVREDRRRSILEHEGQTKELDVLKGDICVNQHVIRLLTKERDSLKGDVEVLKKLNADLKGAAVKDHAIRVELENKIYGLRLEGVRLQKLIPPQVPALPVPNPPVWLRRGWWYAMNQSGKWYAFPSKPELGNTVWSGGGCSTLPAAYSPDVPLDRWREACWQVKE